MESISINRGELANYLRHYSKMSQEEKDDFVRKFYKDDYFFNINDEIRSDFKVVSDKK